MTNMMEVPTQLLYVAMASLFIPCLFAIVAILWTWLRQSSLTRALILILVVLLVGLGIFVAYGVANHYALDDMLKAFFWAIQLLGGSKK